jgi:hypothetical protein
MFFNSDSELTNYYRSEYYAYKDKLTGLYNYPLRWAIVLDQWPTVTGAVTNEV